MHAHAHAEIQPMRQYTQASTSPAKLRKTQTPQKADTPDGDSPSTEQLLQTQSSLQALCDLKDVRIAKEAGIFLKNNMCLSMHSNVWNIFEHSNVGDAYCYYH
jgi:hypothetical protein